MPELVLEVRDLSVSFRTEEGVVRAVDNLSLGARTGDLHRFRDEVFVDIDVGKHGY